MIRYTQIHWLLSTLLIFFLIGVVTSVSPVWAQRPDLPMVRRELERLDRLLETARQVVSAFENREARELILRAEALRKEAETHLSPVRPRDEELLKALMLIRQAIDLTERAIKLGLEGPLTRLRNTVDDLMRRAEYAVIGSCNPEAERLLGEAKKNRAAAESVMNTQAPRRVFELYQISKTLTERALSLVEGRGSNVATTVNRAKERFSHLDARAREAIETSKNPAALQVYQQAIKQARAAEEALQQCKLLIAQQLYFGATRLLLRAIDLALGGQNIPENARKEVALVQDLIEAADEETKDRADARSQVLLERARTLVREAEAAVEQKQYREVRWRIELARNFVDKAMRGRGQTSESTQSFEQRCDEMLQQLTQDIQEVGAKAREANQAEALQLVELATRAHQAAENACRQGQQTKKLRHYRIAFQLIRTAHHFLLRAESLLRDTSAISTPAREEVAQKLTQLDNALQEMSQAATEGGSELDQLFVQRAVELRDRARAALASGQLHVAAETIAVAFELIREIVTSNKPNQNH
jgi:hypothetical protein